MGVPGRFYRRSSAGWSVTERLRCDCARASRWCAGKPTSPAGSLDCHLFQAQLHNQIKSWMNRQQTVIATRPLPKGQTLPVTNCNPGYVTRWRGCSLMGLSAKKYSSRVFSFVLAVTRLISPEGHCPAWLICHKLVSEVVSCIHSRIRSVISKTKNNSRL